MQNIKISNPILSDGDSIQAGPVIGQDEEFDPIREIRRLRQDLLHRLNRFGQFESDSSGEQDDVQSDRNPPSDESPAVENRYDFRQSVPPPNGDYCSTLSTMDHGSKRNSERLFARIREARNLLSRIRLTDPAAKREESLALEEKIKDEIKEQVREEVFAVLKEFPASRNEPDAPVNADPSGISGVCAPSERQTGAAPPEMILSILPPEPGDQSVCAGTSSPRAAEVVDLHEFSGLNILFPSSTAPVGSVSEAGELSRFWIATLKTLNSGMVLLGWFGIFLGVLCHLRGEGHDVCVGLPIAVIGLTLIFIGLLGRAVQDSVNRRTDGGKLTISS